ncbi:UDP-N-acetylmuramoyl-L-alanine--D-glutamate ligase [Leucobacter sp. CSA1]|uniref:UDP-N-acetylmuramoylalanine--D-glutamate ligase n=1 Tax=Leucobacter chromiisoli TaxID=2796471 RepID=A0A934UUV6_9MICO|nr:UDP-N-acetylmuramoyl-L-alanine--D-glutamate ligase [Leucobacter chromiisoli]MBK0419210.1 UDP-N-acetylmuramoyl-L-alanine--D-glutamate ligase [Leucobacter chromiisoli]
MNEEIEPGAVAERVRALSSWHDDWSGLRVAVLGLGVTGFSVADTLVELGSRVRVIHGAPDPDRERLLDVIGSERFAAPGDEEQLADLAAFDPDLVIVSPGYRPDHPLTTWAEDRGVAVWGDIELGWRLRDKTGRVADWICVTGTNGKTTTSQLTAHMLVAGGVRAVPAGNIGTPILDALRDPEGYDAIVVELSSFQLHRLGEISPYASTCLNYAADHLDWHGGAEAYRAAKARVYENTQVACVYNRADAATERMVEEADVVEGARAISFGLDVPPPSGFGVVEGILVDRGFHAERRDSAFELVSVAELAERGLAAPHMVQNVLAAAALARSRGVEPAEIAQAVLTFTPDPHRAQRLGERDGVVWIDDSKATNAHAADASLRALDGVVWIVGGLLKGVDIGELVAAHAHRLRGAVVIGAERAEVLAALAEHAPAVPLVEIVPGETGVDPEGAEAGLAGEIMTAAVRAAASLATAGDTVLLAPAAASMDQFKDYPDRGRKFQAAVSSLGGEADGDPAGADAS